MSQVPYERVMSHMNESCVRVLSCALQRPLYMKICSHTHRYLPLYFYTDVSRHIFTDRGLCNARDLSAQDLRGLYTYKYAHTCKCVHLRAGESLTESSVSRARENSMRTNMHTHVSVYTCALDKLAQRALSRAREHS